MAVLVAGTSLMDLAARPWLATREELRAELDAGAGASLMDLAARLRLATREGGASEAEAESESVADAGDGRVVGGATPGRTPTPTRDEAKRDAAAVPIALDDPQVALGAAVAIAGYDAGAPRAIELWRIAGMRAVRVATGTSRADGSLDLPPFVMPAGDVTLVAAPRGEGADSQSASAPVVASRDPSAPHLIAAGEVSEQRTLVVAVEPAEPGGSIVVADAAQQEIGRAPVGAAPWLEIAVALAPDDAEILVAQEVSDGRRSPWRSVAIARQPQGE